MRIFRNWFPQKEREEISYSQVLEETVPTFTEFSVSVARQIKDVNASILLNYMATIPDHLNRVADEVEEWYPFYEENVKQKTGLNRNELRSATSKLIRLGMVEFKMKKELKMKIFRLKTRQDRAQTN